MNKKRVLIFIVTYNATTTIAKVLSRLPEELFNNSRFETSVLIIDDCSQDDTFGASYDYKLGSEIPLTVLKNPENLGYGGNQKLGYHYAIEQGYDYVALLHGDGQYAPEELPRLLDPLIEENAEAVFGSRMMISRDALRGGMPKYKYLGNKVLTFLQNKIVGTSLSEYHSGYRLYSCRALAELPFDNNSDGFDFDTDIIIQFHSAGLRIKELPIPTFYGDEICYVNGIQYATKILLTCMFYRCQQLGIFYEPKFDTIEANNQYQAKFDFLSSHSLAANSVDSGDQVLSLGCGPAGLVAPFVEKGATLTAVDLEGSSELELVCKEVHQADLDQFEFSRLPKSERFNKILALDIIEHLQSPECFLQKIRDSRQCRNSELVLTTANIAFLPIRLMLLIGSFNYGKRGILDRTHTRLFTFRSLRDALEQSGFEILETKGIPAPFPLAVGENWLSRTLLQLNQIAIAISRGMFSYQIYIKARPHPTLDAILERAMENSAEEAAKYSSKKVANA